MEMRIQKEITVTITYKLFSPVYNNNNKNNNNNNNNNNCDKHNK